MEVPVNRQVAGANPIFFASDDGRSAASSARHRETSELETETRSRLFCKNYLFDDVANSFYFNVSMNPLIGSYRMHAEDLV